MVVPYPSGWFYVANTSTLPCGTVATVRFFGRDLLVLRTEGGRLAAIWSVCSHPESARVTGEELACAACTRSWDPVGPHAVPVAECHELMLAYFHPAGNAPEWHVSPFDMAGWSPFTLCARDYRTWPHVVMRDLADPRHFETVHGFDSLRLVRPFSGDGPRAHMEMSFNRRLAATRGWVKVSGTLTSSVYGLGVQDTVVRSLSGALLTRHLVMPTPVDDTATRVTLASSVRLHLGSEVPAAPLRLVGRALVPLVHRELIHDIDRDARAWESSGPDDVALVLEDSHLAAFRRWKAQFYPAAST